MIQILPRLRKGDFIGKQPILQLMRSRLIWGKWAGKEIKLIMPLICIRLWKALCKENWDIIYILSEMSCQHELS